MVAPFASFIVTLGAGGNIKSQGSVDAVLNEDEEFKAELEKDAEKTEKEEINEKVEDTTAKETNEETTDVAKPDGKLVMEEEKGEGRISRSALFAYLRALGGVGFWIAYPVGLVLSEGKHRGKLDFDNIPIALIW